MLTITRNLNVYSSGIPQIINLSQYDSDFQLVFNLYTSQGALTIPSGTTAEIQGTKKSGTGYSAAATIAGSAVTVTGDNQMTACAGANVFEISLKNNGKVLNSANFILVVEPAALDGNTIQDETVLKELQAIIDGVEDAEQAATDARDAATRAENAARTLTIDSTLTQSGQAADAKATGDRIDAVEESVTDVKEDLNQFAETQILYRQYALENGGINGSGVEIGGSAYMRFSEYVSTAEATDIVFNDKSTSSNYALFACYYDSSKVFQTRVATSGGYQIDTQYAFVRLSFYNANGADETLFRSWITWVLSDATNERFIALNAKIDDALPKINVDDVFSKKMFNLFDGNYLSGVSLNGSTAFTFAANASANSLAVVPVESGKQYSVIVADGGPETNGYYYLKIASVYLDAPIQSATELIGKTNTFLWAQTSHYLKAKTVTIPSGDNYLVVQASLTKQPFLQIVEGEQSDFSVETYTTEYAYYPKGKTEVYSKTEVNSLLEKTTYSIDGNIMTIRMGKAEYKFQRITNNSINIDTWRLYQGAIVENGTSYVMWVNSDAEGAIQITGEDDFVSGFHGDEIMNSIHVFVDGAEIDLTASASDVLFKNITVYVESDVYHCNTSALASTKAFKRYKKLTFENNTVKVSNCYIAQEALSIAQARIALFQCYKTINGIDFFTDYSVNTDYKDYLVSEIGTSKPASSEKMIEADMQTAFANIVFKYLSGSDQKYMGNVTNFASQNRVKFYFDTIFSTTQVAQGEKIMSEFEFKIVP